MPPNDYTTELQTGERELPPVPPEVSEYMSKIAKRAMVTMTPEQRKERARKAGLAKGKKTKNV